MSANDQIFQESDVVGFMRSGTTPSEKQYRRPKTKAVRIYLVRAEVDGVAFQKVGLHSGANVLDRDRKAYKEALRSVQLTQEMAGITEGIALGLCHARHFCDDRVDRLPDDWAGRTEVIGTDEDLTATFDDALETCASHTRKQLRDELQTIYELHRLVVTASPSAEGKRVPARVRRIREALGLESWMSRVRWRNENQWAIGLDTEAAYWQITGQRLELIQPKRGLYSRNPADLASLNWAVRDMERERVDLSKIVC